MAAPKSLEAVSETTAWAVITDRSASSCRASMTTRAAVVRLLGSTPADVVLMDIRMPGVDGIEATRQVTALPDAPRVVVLTTFDLDEYVVAAIGAGASGFLLKDAPPEEMLAAVRTVHAGDSVIAASSTRRLLQHVAPMLRGAAPSSPGGGDDAALAELTPRERDVTLLAAEGLSNREIGARLYLSEGTVRNYLSTAYAKIGVSRRAELGRLLSQATG